MTTRLIVLERLDDFLNGRPALADLVEWAETTLIEPNIPDTEDADAVMDVLMYIGAADTRGFPLTWNLLTSFVERLGGHVTVAVQM